MSLVYLDLSSVWDYLFEITSTYFFSIFQENTKHWNWNHQPILQISLAVSTNQLLVHTSYIGHWVHFSNFKLLKGILKKVLFKELFFFQNKEMFILLSHFPIPKSQTQINFAQNAFFLFANSPDWSMLVFPNYHQNLSKNMIEN